MDKELKQAIINIIKRSKVEVTYEPKNVHNQTYTCIDENNTPVLIIKYNAAAYGLSRRYNMIINLNNANIADIRGRTPSRDREQVDATEIMHIIRNKCQKTY